MLIESKEFQELENMLHCLNRDFVIAGGYARDLFFNVEPKDVDVMVHGSTQDELVELLNNRGWDIAHCHEYDDNRNQSLLYVLQKGDVDLLILSDLAKGIGRFDCNLNEFVCNKQLDNSGYCGNLETFGKLVFTKDGIVTEERKQKMINKAIEFGWDVRECLAKTNPT